MKRNSQLQRNIPALAVGVLLYACNPGDTKRVDMQPEIKEQMVQLKDTPQAGATMLDTAAAIKISAVALTNAYVSNEVKADQDFKDKQLFVTGTIADIKKGMAGDVYVVLKGSERFRAVQCYFDNAEPVAKLTRGMEVAIKGKCSGLMVNVILHHCKVW